MTIAPYSHLSQDWVKRALGQGGSEQRDSSCGGNDQDLGSTGRGKGQGNGNKGNGWTVPIFWS